MVEPKFFEGPQKGNLAAAYAAMDANVDVITAYPITPQTTVVEELSSLVGEEEFIARNQKTQFMRMESEHSVAAGLVGASYAGARVYSATAGQGLLYMTEMIHWMVGARLPVVLSIATRGLTGGGWNIWADYGDIMGLRDSGIMIQLLGTHQEIYDSILMGFNISEHPDVMLPLFPAYGGFVLSHTSKPVKRVPWEEAQKFVIPKRDEWEHVWIDSERPMMTGALIMPQSFYAEFRIKAHEAQLKAISVIKDTMAEFEKRFGRSYGNGLVEPYKADDADVLMIGYGTIAKQAEDAVDVLREQGYKAGALRVRTYRPFPTEDILKYIKKTQIVGVMDRAIAFGNPTAGPLSTDIMAACQRYDSTRNAKILPFIGGLGGRDVTYDDQIEQFKILFDLKEKGEAPKKPYKMWGTYWTGLITGSDKVPQGEEEYFGDI
ncbi:MAG: ferredoxin oxidoreductase [Candidatus Lokiarchaeota archaeon]|nr:ferredoxin oxidoreductase [Candidatus Harpocratesius repetitus]